MIRLQIPPELRINNPDVVINEILDFIRDYVYRAGAQGVVIGLSGGVDSSVAATLCARALGPEKVLGLIMPLRFTPRRDVEDAMNLAKMLNIEFKYIPIDDIELSYKKSVGVEVEDEKLKIPLANLRARIRMTILYFFANSLNRIVVGTSDKSELLIGYFTKYGDGGVDILPIGHLYKTQVRQLALALKIPEHIAFKPSSPQLYPGHKATDEIPADYDVLDRVLYYLFDLGLRPEEVARKAGVGVDIVRRVIEMYIKSMHKRSLPPMVKPLPALKFAEISQG